MQSFHLCLEDILVPLVDHSVLIFIIICVFSVKVAIGTALYNLQVTKYFQLSYSVVRSGHQWLIFTFRLKFFKNGDTEALKFRGTRDLASLTSFINEQLGNAHQVNTKKYLFVIILIQLLLLTEVLIEVEVYLSMPKTIHNVFI